MDSKPNKINSDDIKKALERRHSNDVFFTEVPNGFTGANSNRMDAWAMNASFASPAMFGYEIKVARADFKQDHKYPFYMQCCNLLYVVAPEGVIDSMDELPDGVGFIRASKRRDGSVALYEKKIAKFRDIDVSSDFFKALIINRYRQGKEILESIPLNRYHAKSIKEYLEGKNEYKEVGSMFASMTARKNRENKEFEERYAKLKQVSESAAAVLGLKEWELDALGVEELKERVMPRIKETDIIQKIDELMAELEDAKRRH